MYLDKPGITLSSTKKQPFQQDSHNKTWNLQIVGCYLNSHTQKKEKTLKIRSRENKRGAKRFWDEAEDVSHVVSASGGVFVLKIPFRAKLSADQVASPGRMMESLADYPRDYLRILALLRQHMQHKWEFFKN